DAITSRRNVRNYTEDPILDEDLNRILEATWRTPSSMNEQRWDFIVCTDRARYAGGWSLATILAALLFIPGRWNNPLRSIAGGDVTQSDSASSLEGASNTHAVDTITSQAPRSPSDHWPYSGRASCSPPHGSWPPASGWSGWPVRSTSLARPEPGPRGKPVPPDSRRHLD
ncbi:MAG: hypothetical protein GY939_25745, partial [Actinomycetia bacterium]|nr:hypothetical protein [Actinomycetes bacterium]